MTRIFHKKSSIIGSIILAIGIIIAAGILTVGSNNGRGTTISLHPANAGAATCYQVSEETCVPGVVGGGTGGPIVVCDGDGPRMVAPFYSTSCTPAGFQCTKETNGSCNDTEGVTCTAVAGSFCGIVTPAPTVTLSASPSSITAGNSATLSWSSTNATSCSAAWAASNAVSGSQSVAPGGTTSYTMTCTGAGGSGSASATVTVTAAPPPPP